jgi:hypothetical protein
MSALFELIAQILLEVVLYGTGKLFAQILVPHVGIEPFDRQRSAAGWKWRGFTYSKGNKRFFYTESIQMLGFVVWLVVGLMILAGLHLSRSQLGR